MLMNYLLLQKNDIKKVQEYINSEWSQNHIPARSKELFDWQYAINNDSYNFFRKLNSLIKTGATGTNIADIQITVIK